MLYKLNCSAGLCLRSDLVPDSLYSLSQQIHQFVLRHGRVGPLPAAAREGVTERLLAAERTKVPGLHVAPLDWGGLADENCRQDDGQTGQQTTAHCSHSANIDNIRSGLRCLSAGEIRRIVCQ